MKTLLNLISLKFIASLLGLVYSIIQVRYFGASRTIEVYFAAQTLVYLITSLTQGGKLAEIFLPEYHRLEEKQKGLGFKALNIVINRLLVFGTIIIIVVFIFTPVFMKLIIPGFSPEEQRQAVQIFRVLLPYLFIQIVNSFYITILNAEEKFGRAEFLGMVNIIINISILVLLYHSLGVWALVISLLLGKFVEFFFYYFQLKKIGYTYQSIWQLPHFNHVSFFKAMQATFLYVGATQIYSVVLTASISYLPEGTYAIFKYVQNLANKIKGLFIQPFITIFFTRYSKLVQKSKSVVQEFKKYLTGIISVNNIVLIGSILMGDYIIEIIWGSKKFDESDVQLAYIFLLFNILGIIFSSVGSIYRKMAVSHHKGKQLYFYWSFAQLLSALFAYILINIFKVYGLYFIIPINSFLMAIVSFIVYKKTDTSLPFKFIDKENLIFILLTLLAFLIKFSYTIDKTIPIIKEEKIIIFVTITLILISYPTTVVYKLFKNE